MKPKRNKLKQEDIQLELDFKSTKEKLIELDVEGLIKNIEV